MKSTNYREEIEKVAGVWTVIRKIDLLTGCPVCVKCDEIISEEEDNQLNGLCEKCDYFLELDNTEEWLDRETNKYAMAR